MDLKPNKTEDSPICAYRRLTSPLRWKKIFQAIGNQKKSGSAILIKDKIDFKPETVCNKGQIRPLYNYKWDKTRRVYIF